MTPRAEYEHAKVEQRIAAEFVRVWGKARRHLVVAAGVMVRFDNGTETSRKMLVAFVARGLIQRSYRRTTRGHWYERVEKFA